MADRIKISTSQVTDFKVCRELHRLRWVLRVVPVDYQVASLRMGTGVHGALDLYRTSGRLEPAFAALAEELTGFDLAAAQAMVAGYAAKWNNDRLEVVASEQRFTLVRDTYVLKGAIDALVRDSEGRLGVLETKTTGQEIDPGALYWRTLDIDDQVGIYLPGAESLNLGSPEYVLYDVLRRPRVEPKRATPPEKRKYRKDGQLYASQREHDEDVGAYRGRCVEHMLERPETYFARRKLVRLDEEAEAHRRDLLRIVDEMQTTYDDPDTPAPKTPTSCKRFGRICEYVDVCSHRASIDDPTLFKKEERFEQTQQNSQGDEGGAVERASVRGPRRRQDDLW